MKVLRIERIAVADAAVEALVRVVDHDYMRTSASPGLAARAVELLPTLERHRCENDLHARFIDELNDTESPHLLEHLTVELMALAGSPRSLPGRTYWDFEAEGKGVFHVRVAFDDDLVALGALKEADLIVDWLFLGGARPDIAERTRALRALRGGAEGGGPESVTGAWREGC